MTNSNFSFPIRCISYYATSKSNIDNKHSYEFWMRGICVRMICDKPCARGDVIEIQKIEDTTSGILITTKLIDEWEQEYPVLNFISGRLIYNKWVKFEYEASDGIQILKPIEQVLSNNFSLGFIILCYKSGIITCVDTQTNNKFDVHVNLTWE